MIYFIQNTTTKNIKIGYSNNPKKRLDSLQTATPEKLVLLGSIQGGLEDESAFHQKFAMYALTGEWFKADILRDVQSILANAAASPLQQKTNVIIVGDSDPNFILSSDPQKMADKRTLEAAVHRALNDIHAKTPISWVITGGERMLEEFAWDWAKKNKVELYRYWPNWKKYGRAAAFKIGPQMLRSMFDPKLLLVFLGRKSSSNTQSLVRKAEKAGIEVVRISWASPVLIT